MPAMSNSAPEQLPLPRPAAVPPQPPSRLPKLLFFIGLLAIGGIALYYLAVGRQKMAAKAAATATIQTARVHRATVENRIRLTGNTSARNFANVVAPSQRGPDAGQSMILLKLVTSGKFVNKGDIVAEIDPQSIKDHLDDTIAGLRDKENDLKKRKVEQELDMENLQQSLRRAKAALDKAQLDLRTTNIRTDIDREILQLAVEEADAAYKELLTDVPQKVNSQKADMRILEITKKMEDMHVERHATDLRRYVVRAPMSGMVVVQTMNRPGGDQVMLAVGDRVNPGQPMMKIIDTKTMQVEGTINQAQSSLFRVGQSASVKLDAFPGSNYHAKVYTIGALATAGGRNAQYFIRSVPVRIQLSAPDEKVLPDLSAAADVLLGREENSLTVPVNAIHEEGGQDVVYVRNEKGFDRRHVEAGLSDGLVVAIRDGLKEGDVVRID
jgi:multidrug efflux pump subunit AcrA (membrane-fusion protein)